MYMKWKYILSPYKTHVSISFDRSDKFSYIKFSKISLRINLTIHLTLTLKELSHS